MSIIYGYSDRLWKVVHDFEYTGVGVGFTLPAGKYLLICKGGAGGIPSTVPTSVTLGGIAYGVLNLTDSSTQLFAYVGGNGGAPMTNNVPGVGGFNGGGNGGKAPSTSYVAGAGGGGASDIRIGTDSLYSRVIVAGGGGGGINFTGFTTNIASLGGGPVGGPVLGTGSTSTSDVNWCKYASQTDGYLFGIGMDGIDKTSGTSSTGSQGASGGGGGWFGGYTSATTTGSDAYTSTNGGGGSGYVLTEESYKPDGYLLGEEYHLSDIFMNCGGADEPRVIVCELTDSYKSGDTLIFPNVNSKTKFFMFKGEYNLKCYGGCGGTRSATIASAALGGYAEGILKTPIHTDVYVYTGGSGLFDGFMAASLGQSFGDLYNTSRSFNGGGSSGGHSLKSGAGGGASDIRIGTDSLYSRIIVAGGGGGWGCYSGGAGGGVTGGASANYGYGTCPGSGTQVNSPQSSTCPTINGGFGYGGNGLFEHNGYGGAGGSGWFGGSGTQPDVSRDDDKGGAGGSGYVLTEESYKPDEYLLGEEYYLKDTILTQGGNNLPIGHTKVVIEVIDGNFIRFMCRDNEGYKIFNESQNKWIYYSNEMPTLEIFKEIASYDMINDDGLLDQYDIIIYDEKEEVDNISLNVLPIPQKITRTFKYSGSISKVIPDAEFDSNLYDLKINISTGYASGDGVNKTYMLETIITKKVDTNEPFKLYSIEMI